MDWPITLFITVLTTALGMIASGVVATASISWHHISSREGGAGCFMVMMGLLGGIASGLIALVTTGLVATSSTPRFMRAWGLSWGIVLGLAAVAALASRLAAHVPARIKGHLLDLEVEFRMPAGEEDPTALADGENFVRLGSNNPWTHIQKKSEQGELRLVDAALRDGRWIIPGSVFIFTTSGKRSLDFTIGGKSRGGFIVPLPARPGRKFEQWSEWYPRGLASGGTWPDSRVSYRFRVRQRLPLPPPADLAVVAATEFAALAHDAPLGDWLAFLKTDTPTDREQAILGVVSSRPGDLADDIRSEDNAVSERAMYAVTKLQAVAPEIAQAILDVGRDLVEQIQRFGFDGSDADLSRTIRYRFGSWHRAWWTVHQNLELDPRQYLEEIWKLANAQRENVDMEEVAFNAKFHLDNLPQPTASLR